MVAKSDIKVEYVALDDIAKWPRNPKLHDLPQMQDSVRRFGFVSPLLYDETTGRLVAGHGRLETLQAMKAAGEDPPQRVRTKGKTWLVPVLRGIGFENEREAEAYLLADNRLVQTGGWDDKALLAILDDLSQNDALAGVGWTDAQVAELLSVANESAAEEQQGRGFGEDLEVYANAEIKQVVLYFQADEYEGVMKRLQSVMESEGVTTHTAAVLALIAKYEASSGN